MLGKSYQNTRSRYEIHLVLYNPVVHTIVPHSVSSASSTTSNGWKNLAWSMLSQTSATRTSSSNRSRRQHRADPTPSREHPHRSPSPHDAACEAPTPSTRPSTTHPSSGNQHPRCSRSRSTSRPTTLTFPARSVPRASVAGSIRPCARSLALQATPKRRGSLRVVANTPAKSTKRVRVCCNNLQNSITTSASRPSRSHPSTPQIQGLERRQGHGCHAAAQEPQPVLLPAHSARCPAGTG